MTTKAKICWKEKASVIDNLTVRFVPDTGYPAKNKCYVIFKKLNIIFINFSSFSAFDSSFVSFNFLNFF